MTRPRLLLASLFAAAVAVPAAAVSRRHDVPDSQYLALAQNYPEVCKFTFGDPKQCGSGVLIAPQWVLMASHNLMFRKGELAVEFGPDRYRIDWACRHPADLPQPNSASFMHDIALCHLTEPVRGVTPAKLYDGRDEVGKEVTIVGFGMVGDGKAGVPDGSELGVRRACKNIIDAAGTFESKRADTPDGSLLFYDFDPPETALPLEGMMTSGDSGGGVFLETPAGRRLVGINSGTFGPDGKKAAAAGPKHLYGILSRTVRVSSFGPWAAATIRRYEAGAEPLRGLVAHWSFDEEKGEFAQDVSGVGHRGTIHNAPRVDGIKGKALDFRSGPKTFALPLEKKDYVLVPNDTGLFLKVGAAVANDLKLKNDLTVAAWVRRERSGGMTGKATTDVDTIVAKADPAGKAPGDWSFILWEKKLRLYKGDQEFVASEKTPALETYGEWQYVAVTRAGDDVTFYRNGDAIGRAKLAGEFTVSDNPLLIGNLPGQGLDLSGRLDEVRVYDRALDRAEVVKLRDFDSMIPVSWEKLPLPACDKASYNPEGERQAFALQFDAQKRVYVGNRFNGTGAGCVLRTADGGKTWDELGPPGEWSLKVGPNDGGFRIHPAKPDWFYMGSENRGVYVSFDGGKTWGHPVSGSWTDSIGHGFTFAFHPTNPLRVYASGGRGVYRTDDGGKTWANLGLPVSQTNWVTVDPAEPTRVYAGATWKLGHLLRSTDGGDTWAEATTGFPDGRVTPTGYPNRAVWQVEVSPKDHKTVYASTATGVFVSANGGDEWTRAGPAAKGVLSGMVTFALHPTDPAVIASSGYLGRVHLTRDGGMTWADITGELRTGAMPHRAFGIVVCELAFDPADPAVLYVARSDGVYRARLPKAGR